MTRINSLKSEPERQALYERHRKSYGLIILSPIGLGGLMQGDLLGGGISAGGIVLGSLLISNLDSYESKDRAAIIFMGAAGIVAGIVWGITSFIIYTYNWNDNLEYSLNSGTRISFFDQPEVFFDKDGKYQLGINLLTMRY